MLHFQNISKSFPGGFSIRSLDLEAETGRTTVLLGPSGCGKSTLLRMVVGLVDIDKGQIRFGDRILGEDNLLECRRHIGYVIQEGGLFPHLTAEGNVALMARYLGRTEQHIAARTRELAGLVRLPEDLLRRFPADLSGGQRQRVGLMRALMLDPDLLLLDEPLGALDPMIRFELQNDLKSIFSELHKTVLLVTHDLAEAGFLGDTIVLLRDGRIIQQGAARELIESPAEPFVEQFINAQRASFITLQEPDP